MCLIIYRPAESANKDINPSHITASCTRNNDAGGAMWVEDGRVMVSKTTEKHLDKWSLEQLKLVQGKPFAMHHRFTTHGDNNLDNAHPFVLLSKESGDAIDLVMMHNGVISRTSSSVGKRGRSDTCIYVDDYLRPLLEGNHSLIYNPLFQEHIEAFIGTGSKLLFMDNEGRVIIINEGAGEWIEGATGAKGNDYWISNRYSIQSQTYYERAPYYGNNVGVYSLPQTHYKKGADSQVGKPQPQYKPLKTSTTTTGMTSSTNQQQGGGTNTNYKAHTATGKDDKEMTPWELVGLSAQELDEYALSIPEYLIDPLIGCSIREIEAMVEKMGSVALASLLFEMLQQLKEMTDYEDDEDAESLDGCLLMDNTIGELEEDDTDVYSEVLLPKRIIR